jgi:AbrB family looped-hinge helix DNA binding protein
MFTATITSKGQVTIPKEIRDALRLRSGHRLDFLARKDGTVVVRPLTLDAMTLQGIVKTKRKRPVSLDEMDLAVAKGASSR